MLRLRQTTTAFLLAIVATATPAAENENAAKAKPPEAKTPKFLLRYQFKPGEQLRYETINHLTQQGVVGQGEKVDTTKIVQNRLFTIGKVDDDTAAASMQFEYVRMELKSDDNEPEIFDSTMPLKDVSKKFQGTARQLAGKAPSYILQCAGTPVSDAGIEQIPEGGQASFMIPLPENQIAVGDTWKVNMIVSVRLDEGVKRQIKLLRTYRLENVDDGVATIGFFTSVMSTVKAPALKAQLLQATPQGEIRFDIENGKLLRKEFRFDRMVMGALGPGSVLSAKGATVETLNYETESK